MSGFDQRSAVFLQEMGIGPLWTLRARAEAAPQQAAPPEPAARPEPAPVQPAPVRPTLVQPAPVIARQDTPVVDEQPGAAGEPDIAQMDWAELKAAIASCTRCAICKNKKPVYGAGPRQARWLVTAGAASAIDEKEGQPVAGDAGRLLGNMLAAVGLSRDQDVYVTSLIKCRPTSANGGDRAPTLDEAMACRPYLERELVLSGAPLVLTLGQIAANALQAKPLTEPLAQSRGQVHSFNGVKLVATLHPGELLRRGADKALAWADLCLARHEDGRGG